MRFSSPHNIHSNAQNKQNKENENENETKTVVTNKKIVSIVLAFFDLAVHKK